MPDVIALSGGKDSTALACWLHENEPRDYIRVCTPTGDELPGMIDHWRGLARVLGPLTPVTTGESLKGLIGRWKALPNHRARWCTRALKIEPYYRFLASLGPSISYVGLRADEEDRQGMQFPETANVKLRFPLRELGWSEEDVWSYLADIPGHTKPTMAEDIPPRTDCARCYHQTIGEWWNLYSYYPDLFWDAAADEQMVTDHRGKPYTFRSPQRDSWPASLADLGERFAAGEVPRGAGQQDLFNHRRSMCRVCSL